MISFLSRAHSLELTRSMAHRLLIALAASTTLLQHSWAQETITPELLVANPARINGNGAQWRASLFSAVEQDADSWLAPFVYGILSQHHAGQRSLPDMVAEGDLMRDHLRRVGDGPGSLELRIGLHANARARRYSASPMELEADLYPEFVSRWHLVGPLGALDERAPAAAPAPDLSSRFGDGALARFSPEPEASDSTEPRFADAYLSADGKLRPWTSVIRYPNQISARWGRSVFPEAGLTYALAFVRPPAAEANSTIILEIRTERAVRAWWNDELAIDEPRPSALDNSSVLRARVTPRADGWNALLLRLPTNESAPLSVRFLREDGHVLRVEQPAADASPLSTWEPPAAASSPEALPRIAAELIAAVPSGPLAPALRMFIARRAGRYDWALAEPRPEPGQGPDADSQATSAWLQQQLSAVLDAGHLPDEWKRRESLKIVAELEAAGALNVGAYWYKVQHLIKENKPVEALELANAWRDLNPDHSDPTLWRLLALDAIDRAKTLGQAELEELVRNYPHFTRARNLLAERLVNEGAVALATEHVWASLTTDAYRDEGIDFLVEILGQTNDPRLETLEAATLAWDALHPKAVPASSEMIQILESQNRHDEALALEQAFANAHPNSPNAWWALATRRVEAGDEAGAVEALRRELSFAPANEQSRELLTQLGVEDPVEAFFEEFAPDSGAAMALAKEKESASVVDALDSGLVYLFPDGSAHARYQTLTLPMDRSGAEALNAIPVREGTRRIRILKSNGDVQEPVDVNGEWVLPAIEAGDVIDTVWDTITEGIPGTPPDSQLWRFASFERAFPTSRWVIFVPDDLPGDLKLLHYNGSHEVIEREGGTVHVLEASNPQFIAEPLQPTEIELLPVATYGADRDRSDELRSWWRYGMYNQAIPADLEAELAQFIEEALVGIDPGDMRARAKALYEAVDEYLQAYEGSEDAASVWLTEKGWPVFLLSALYERAGVPFEWAVLKSRLSPELEAPTPLVFDGIISLAQMVLRLGLEDDAGDPIWIIHSGSRGTPFGAIVDSQVGAGAYVLESSRGDAREEMLPRTQAGEFWNLDLSLTYTLQPDGSALVTGSMSDPSPQGQMMIQSAREATAEAREGFAKSQAANFTPGVDLQEARLVLDGSEGPGMQLRFSGTAARFANSTNRGFAAAIPFVPLQLDKSFGPAERRWPIAMRSVTRVRASIRVEPGEGWALKPAAPSAIESREGLTVGLEVMDDPSGARVYLQLFEQRGLIMEPGEVPAFLQRMGEIEQEFRRPLLLEKR